jgi:radical SAM protein with 4Fe4S-binding SPASM domain
LAQHGCPEVSLTGGEVGLRRDLVDLVAYALSQGFLLNVLTNATLITPELARRLGDFCLQSVQLSLYGVTPEVHEQITRKPGSFAKTIRGARLLIDSGVPVKFLYFVQQDNVQEAFHARTFAAELGAECGFDSKLVPNRDGSTEVLKYGVTSAQQVELYRAGIREPELDFTCAAAAATARITADGEVFPCALINSRSLGNLNTRSLAEIWRSPERQILRREILGYSSSRCIGCSLASSCPPCAAMKGFDQNKSFPENQHQLVEGCLLAAANHKYCVSSVPLSTSGRSADAQPNRQPAFPAPTVSKFDD